MRTLIFTLLALSLCATAAADSNIGKSTPNREVMLFYQPTHLCLDVRARHPSSRASIRLLNFDLLGIVVMREDRPSIPGPQPCRLCCFRSEGIQHALVDLAVRW